MATTTLSSFQTADQFIPPVSTLEEAWNIDLKIKDLQEKIARLQARKDTILEEHMQAGVMQEGPFSIKRDLKTRRTINTDKIREKYPGEYAEAVREFAADKYRPTQKELGKYLTSYQLEKVSDITEYVSYSVDWDPHQGAEQ